MRGYERGVLVSCCQLLSCQRSTPGRSVAPTDTVSAAKNSSRALLSANAPKPIEGGATGELKVTRLLGAACALDDAGLAYCWAPPTSLLTDETGDAVPKRVPELDGGRAFSKSSYFSYLLTGSGQIQIWGKSRHSYLGDISQPKPLPGLSDITQLQTTGDMVYAGQESGSVMWWNDSFASPEAGEPGIVVSSRPELATKNMQALAPSFNSHYVGRDGAVYHGQGSTQSKVDGISEARSMADCGGMACAVDGSKHARCWHPSHPSPIFDLQTPAPVASLACAGGGDVFALLDDGTVMVGTERFAPLELTRIPTLDNVAELALCRGTLNCPHCFKLRSGVLSCWGESRERKLGGGEWPKNPQLVPLQKGRDVTTPRTP